MNLDSVRTLLFTPANRADRFDKAKSTGADGIILDLEDAIPLAQKDAARKIAIDYFQKTKSEHDSNFLRCLRVNSIKTPAGLKDILALLESNTKPDVIVIPKGEYPGEIIVLDTLLASIKPIYIILIETAVGLNHANAIACSSPNVKALFMGGADLAADLKSDISWDSMLAARSIIVRSAASAGIAALDVPYFNLQDTDSSALIQETKKIKALGFTGKCAIHPKHVKPILDTFTPTEKEIEEAKHIVEMFDKASGKVCEINGKMIDVPLYRMAKRIIEISTKSVSI